MSFTESDSIIDTRPDIPVSTIATASAALSDTAFTLAGSAQTAASVDFSLQGIIGVGAEMNSDLIFFNAFEMTSTELVSFEGFLDIVQIDGLPQSLVTGDITLINQDTGASIFSTNSSGAFSEVFTLEAGVYELNIELSAFTAVNFETLDGELSSSAEATLTVIPAPGSAVVALGALGLVGRRRR